MLINMRGKKMKGYMGYPIIKAKQLKEDSNAWVENNVEHMFHLEHFPNTTKAYTLFIDGELPTTDCEGTDCCMVGNTLWYGLHKIREGLI